jgi:predicted transcriptional regulator
MSKTVSFVAKDELAEWLEQRADDRMKSISAVCQDIVAAEYRREQAETAKSVKRGSEGGALESESLFVFKSKSGAETARQQFAEHLSDDDDGRLKEVRIAQGTPQGVVDELERWAESRENGP